MTVTYTKFVYVQVSIVYLFNAVRGSTGKHSSWLFAIQCTLYQLDEAFLAFESAQIHGKPVVEHSYSQLQAASIYFPYKRVNISVNQWLIIDVSAAKYYKLADS